MAKIFSTIFCGVRAVADDPGAVEAHRVRSSLALARGSPDNLKHHAEVFIPSTAAWILSVGVVIASRAFEWWARGGTWCTASRARLYLLYLLARPLQGRERERRDWYILKANVWIAVFSFIATTGTRTTSTAS